MADGAGGGKGTAGVVLKVLGGIALLTIVCCGGSALIFRDELRKGVSMVRSGVEMGREMGAGAQEFGRLLVQDVDPGAVWEIQGQNESVALLIGLPTVPPADELAALQDKVWTAYAAAFAAGSPPIEEVAIGVAGSVRDATNRSGKVRSWRGNVVSADELVARTGVAPPPVSEFFEQLMELTHEADPGQPESGEPAPEAPDDGAAPDDSQR